ncbi:SH3 domain-containing protein [Pararoseomonas baculiformis]|uniref:SH3 domain-containing protein n=1 Tax=Pararoseomonas baculiformis TaxID=2820812 RepID=UPI0038D15C47
MNLRSSPTGGGAVLRVLPRGTRLKVFAEAPGGWYQVGVTEPTGWIHGSMLQR